MSNVNICRYCGEEIVEIEIKTFFGKRENMWVHSKTRDSAGYKCMVCGSYAGLDKTINCPNCTSPLWAYGTSEHYAKP